MQVTGNLLQESAPRLLSAQYNEHNGSRRFNDGSMEVLTKHTNLQVLDIHSVRDVTPAGLELLSRLPDLQDLSLTGIAIPINSTTIPSTLSKWTSLKNLRLSFVGPMPRGKSALDPELLGQLTQLKELCLTQVGALTGFVFWLCPCTLRLSFGSLSSCDGG